MESSTEYMQRLDKQAQILQLSKYFLFPSSSFLPSFFFHLPSTKQHTLPWIIQKAILV